MARINLIAIAPVVWIAVLVGCATTPGREKPLDLVIEVKVSPTEDLIAVSTISHQVALFGRNPILFKKLLTPEGFKVKARGIKAMSWAPPVAFSLDGKKLIAAGVDGQVVKWDLASGAEEFRSSVEGRTVDIQFSPEGVRFITVGPGVTVWSSDSGEVIHTLELPETTTATSVCPTPDGLAVLVGLSDGRIAIYDETVIQPFRVWQAHEEAVSGLAFSPDGLSLASIAGYGDLHMWTPAGEKESASHDWLLGDSAEGVRDKDLLDMGRGSPNDSRSRVAFSPDGEYLIASTVRHIDEPVLFDVHAFYLRYDDHWKFARVMLASAIAFTRDGRTLVTGGLAAPTELLLENADQKGD